MVVMHGRAAAVAVGPGERGDGVRAVAAGEPGVASGASSAGHRHRLGIMRGKPAEPSVSHVVPRRVARKVERRGIWIHDETWACFRTWSYLRNLVVPQKGGTARRASERWNGAEPGRASETNKYNCVFLVSVTMLCWRPIPFPKEPIFCSSLSFLQI